MDRKEVIINTACRKFSRYGYSKTTMEDIAKECRITKPTLYNHFPAKLDLFKAVIDVEQRSFYTMLGEMASKQASATDRLRAYADMHVKSLKKFMNIGEFSRKAFLDFHPDVLTVYESYRQKEESIIAGWIKEGVASREFEPVNVHSAARMFYLSIAALKFDILFMQEIYRTEIVAEEENINLLEEELDRFVSIYLNGLHTRGGAL
jgi:AcrR family transcriptional regulator